MDILTETGRTLYLPDDVRATVVDVDLHRAIVIRADLAGRRFERCSFRNALLGFTRLDGAAFNDCILALAEFDASSTVGATFTGGILNGASFRGANLARSAFDTVDLSGAVFSGASLDGVDFGAAELEGAKLVDALYTTTTRWPEGFDHRGAGMRLVADTAAT